MFKITITSRTGVKTIHAIADSRKAYRCYQQNRNRANHIIKLEDDNIVLAITDNTLISEI